ncbi:MAG TPA: phospho-N-acetylmuramoyl-pentapeptide-transferase, partial [Acidimicrobiales bacterium]
MLSLMESGGVGFLFALFVTPLWIRFVRERSLGQQIREDGPESHLAKAGTPTMGGVVIVVAAVLGYLTGHVGTSIVFTRGGILAIGVTIASGLLGLIDDYLGIRNARNLGLKKRGKFAGQLVIAGVFATLAIGWVHTSTHLSFTRVTFPGWNLSQIGWVALAVFVVIASSNAVNLTDGLDGLAAGSGAFCFGVLSIIGYWQFRHFAIYHLHAALDLGLVAVALVGA